MCLLMPQGASFSPLQIGGLLDVLVQLGYGATEDGLLPRSSLHLQSADCQYARLMLGVLGFRYLPVIVLEDAQ